VCVSQKNLYDPEIIDSLPLSCVPMYLIVHVGVCVCKKESHMNYPSIMKLSRCQLSTMQITHKILLSIFSLLFTAEVPSCRRVSIPEKDRPLINALVQEENTLSPKKRHICNGRFLTMHKRRRKKLTTRSLAFEPAIIDDILHGQVKCILRQVGNWRFNAFTLETVTGGEHCYLFYRLLSNVQLLCTNYKESSQKLYLRQVIVTIIHHLPLLRDFLIDFRHLAVKA
jgi:hypothetical protein